MNGCVLPNSPIAVDLWKIRQCPQVKVFFLSHMHADHTCGLTPSWPHPIYCSPVTAKLLQHKFQIKKTLILELEVSESHIIPLDRAGQETATVSVIDANHCPGSVMFLFQGYFGTILYTADFRYTAAMFIDTPLSDISPVDVLYLDNTYCDPKYEFPTRTVAQQKIISIIEKHPEHLCLIGCRTLGKEEMLVSVAKHFQTWIIVSPNYYENLKVLNIQNVFTTDPADGYIHVIPFHQLNKKARAQWEEKTGTPCIGILPTALYVGLDVPPYAEKEKIYVVPYSDHSSYSELHSFVSKTKPRHIVPVVKAKGKGIFKTNISHQADMSCFKDHMDSHPRKCFELPVSVSIYMKSATSVQQRVHKTARKNGKQSRLVRKVSYPKGVIFSTPTKSAREDDDDLVQTPLPSVTRTDSSTQVQVPLQSVTRTDSSTQVQVPLQSVTRTDCSTQVQVPLQSVTSTRGPTWLTACKRDTVSDVVFSHVHGLVKSTSSSVTQPKQMSDIGNMSVHHSEIKVRSINHVCGTTSDVSGAYTDVSSVSTEVTGLCSSNSNGSESNQSRHSGNKSTHVPCGIVDDPCLKLFVSTSSPPPEVIDLCSSGKSDSTRDSCYLMNENNTCGKSLNAGLSRTTMNALCQGESSQIHVADRTGLSLPVVHFTGTFHGKHQKLQCSQFKSSAESDITKDEQPKCDPRSPTSNQMSKPVLQLNKLRIRSETNVSKGLLIPSVNHVNSSKNKNEINCASDSPSANGPTTKRTKLSCMNWSPSSHECCGLNRPDCKKSVAAPDIQPSYTVIPLSKRKSKAEVRKIFRETMKDYM